MEQLTVSQFSGGLTDNFIGASPDKWERCDNLVLTDDYRIKTRPGMSLVYTVPTAARIAGTSGTVGIYRNVTALIPYTTVAGTNSFMRHSHEQLSIDSSGMTALVNHLGSDQLLTSLSGIGRRHVSFSSWRSNTFVASENYQKPLLVFPSTSIRVTTAGLPRPPNTLDATFVALTTTPVTTYKFIVAFVYKYTYTVNGVTFISRSSPRFFRKEFSTSISSGDVVSRRLVNASQEHYVTASAYGSMKVEYYRTTDAGNVLYLVGEDDNGTPVGITDGISDTDLVKREVLYTTGGVAENDRPPKCKFVHMTTDFGYYANGKEVQVTTDADGELFTNRIWQSKQGDVDSVPSEFYVDVDDEIVGISSVRSVPIVFTRKAVYRIDGQYDDFGRGGMQIEKLSDYNGGVGHLNLVQTLDTLYFAGTDGFYRTNGYSMELISPDFVETYKTLVNTPEKGTNIYGTYDDKNKLILWSMNVTNETTDNNGIYVYKINAGVFTTWGSGARIDRGNGDRYDQFTENFQPISLLVQDGVVFAGDSRGYTLKFDTVTRIDPKIDTTVADVEDFSTLPIIYDYISASFDHGAAAIRKYGTKIVAKLNPIFGGTGSNTTLQISTDVDNSRIYGDCAEIYRTNLLFWGDPILVWGDSELEWNAGNKVSQHGRRFPAKKLRYSYRKIAMTNAFVGIVGSDDLGLANTNDLITSAEITLVSGADFFFITDPIDYFVALEQDGYIDEYKITSLSVDKKTITVAKTASVVFNTPTKWVIRGFRKEDILVLVEWTCYFVPLSDTFAQFRGRIGENA